LNKFIVIFLLSFFSSFKILAYADTIPVVASFSILGDIVKNIGGDKVSVISIVGTNQDPHDYELKPSDLTIINKSRVLFVNGLGLEAFWLTSIMKSYDGYKVVVSKGIKPRLLRENISNVRVDPHIWNNPVNVIDYYIPNILSALIAVSPQNKDYFESNAKNYVDRLNQLNNWVILQFKGIKAHNRDLKAVTTHDAFNYFALQYGIKFIAVQGISTDSDASAKDIVNLEKLIKSSGTKVVFLENMTNNQLIKQISKDTNAKVGGVLYSDALSLPNQPANTYINMLKYNVTTLCNAWKNN
jgi:zinc/manganese transport system substrate-binding protein